MKKLFKVLGCFILIGVILVVCLKLFGEKIVLAYVQPSGSVVELPTPTRPDYADEKNWIALPSKQDESDLIPIGLAVSEVSKEMPVDVFYIHPTGYFATDSWNSDMAPERGAAQQSQAMLALQASVFNGCCDVYAPQYREATLWSFLEKENDNGTQALAIAYTDVERAFDYFIKHYAKDKPFIIASHSQGSTHAMRLLEEKIEHTELYGRMVAAYVIGYKVPLDKFGTAFNNITVCQSAEQTGCLISWDTYGDGAKDVDDTVPQWYTSGWQQKGQLETVCVNPLSWKQDQQRADASLHLGAVATPELSFFENVFLDKNTGKKITELSLSSTPKTWAECRANGLFIAAQKSDKLIDKLNSKRVYHVYDYHYFYLNLRANARLRSQAFLNKGI